MPEESEDMDVYSAAFVLTESFQVTGETDEPHDDMSVIGAPVRGLRDLHVASWSKSTCLEAPRGPAQWLLHGSSIGTASALRRTSKKQSAEEDLAAAFMTDSRAANEQKRVP